jgi:hypothetical protein
MIYLKSSKLTVADSPVSEWGSFVRFLEIADDGYVNRQVDLFVNGCALMYDRELWCDEESMLADAKYDAESFTALWGPSQEISSEQFEVEWEFAEAAPNQPQEYDVEEVWPVLALLDDGDGDGDFTGSAGKPHPMDLAGKPHPMDLVEVERMLGLEEKKEEEPTRVKIEFKIGEVVRIKSGTFESFEGEIDVIDEATGKLSVLIEIFGRQTPHEVEYHEVERP